MPIHSYARYASGSTVTVQPYLGAVTVGGVLETTKFADDGVTARFAVDLTSVVTPVDSLVFIANGHDFADADVRWDGTQLLQPATPVDISNALQGANITVVSPLSSDGTELELVTGDSYTVANGRSLQFSITNEPALVGTTCHLRFNGADLATVAVTLATQTLILSDILATATTLLPTGASQPYQLRFIANDGNVATIVKGSANVIQGI